jgi:aspartate racemase
VSRTIGILGGMGPAATVDLMARIVAATPAKGDEDHLHLLIDSNPQVANRNLAIAGMGPSPAPVLVAMARGLEAQGAEMLAIACNSAHAWADDIRAATAIPLVSMIEATVAAIPAGVRRVGLLAADACLAAGLYQKPFAEAGLDTLVTEDQSGFMRLVYGVKAGETGPDGRAGMAEIAKGLVDRGAEVIVAACTEVPLLLAAADVTVPLIDSTDALVRQLIREAIA